MDNSKFKNQNSRLKISPARIAAFEILLKIEKEKAFSSILLPIYEEKFSKVDRSLCHELVLGVLRKQLYLDRIIDIFTNKKLDLEVRIILRLGIYQLLFLDKIPAYSAINEAVNLVVRIKKTSAKGFVNAILRRTTREKIELTFESEVEQISIETSHPIWLLEKWISKLGINETKRLAVANNETPALNSRLTEKTSAAIKEKLENETLDTSFLFDLATNGKIYFQDDASQLVGKAVELKENEKFLDVCSAPGSKLTQIATYSNQMLFGGDLHFQRVKTIERSAKKQGLKNIQVLQYDAEKTLPFAEETFDVILLDAPCSGTGTIRHNPEIRYHLKEKDFSELSAKQLKILQNASNLLKRGGRLIYSTCSLEIEENEEILNKFLEENEAFSLIESNILKKFKTEKGFYRTFPHRDSMDGFFIATLKKS